MSGTLPFARSSGDGSGAQALYPVTRRIEFSTDVAIALNQTEQRFKRRPPLTRFVLPYNRVNRTDMLAFRSFHASQRGTFDATWGFTLGATLYSNLTFEDDTFIATEEDVTRTHYSFTLKARQTKNATATAGDYGGTFPTLANGAMTQFPYIQTRRFAVLVNDNPACGIRYTWTWFGAGLTGFPTGALWGWQLGFPNISDADLLTLETFFRAQWGRWGTFTMVDPEDASSHTKCRFDQDVMDIVHMAPNQNSCTLNILETN
jgi:hypothetical protein